MSELTALSYQCFDRGDWLQPYFDLEDWHRYFQTLAAIHSALVNTAAHVLGRPELLSSSCSTGAIDALSSDWNLPAYTRVVSRISLEHYFGVRAQHPILAKHIRFSDPFRSLWMQRSHRDQ